MLTNKYKYKYKYKCKYFFTDHIYTDHIYTDHICTDHICGNYYTDHICGNCLFVKLYINFATKHHNKDDVLIQ